MIARWIEQCWYRHSPTVFLLLPLSLVYFCLTWFRRKLYAWNVLKKQNLGVPVIVVGNITVGGSGKTPLVIWLAEFLDGLGYRPGVIARGYKGEAAHWPQRVNQNSDVEEMGDEAVLLARNCECPVAAGPDRVAAARLLIERGGCDIIVSDDGLQHYRLARDIEIAVINDRRRFGNGFLLPAGPLRERLSRLREVDFQIVQVSAKKEIAAQSIESGAQMGGYKMHYQIHALINIHDKKLEKPLSEFNGKTVYAVAGIGDTQGFFSALEGEGIDVKPVSFPDHHIYKQNDLEMAEPFPIIMTQKDAVKCERLKIQNAWYLFAKIIPDPQFIEALTARLQGLNQ